MAYRISYEQRYAVEQFVNINDAQVKNIVEVSPFFSRRRSMTYYLIRGCLLLEVIIINNSYLKGFTYDTLKITLRRKGKVLHKFNMLSQ